MDKFSTDDGKYHCIRKNDFVCSIAVDLAMSFDISRSGKLVDPSARWL